MSTGIRIGSRIPTSRGCGRGDGLPARFAPAGKLETHVEEASDVAALPGGGLLVVGDRSDKVWVRDGRGREEKVDLPGLKKRKSQLEGAAYDPARHRLYLSREERRELLCYKWNPLGRDEPVLEKRIDIESFVGGSPNKGIEGLAWLPAELSPTGEASLVLAKEGKPRRIILMSPDGVRAVEVKLDEQVRAVCDDLSAVTVDPRSGHLFVASEESSTMAQLRLVPDGDRVRARLVQSIPLNNKHGRPLASVEGLAFNAKGDLFVLTEKDGELHRLKRQ